MTVKEFLGKLEQKDKVEIVDCVGKNVFKCFSGDVLDVYLKPYTSYLHFTVIGAYYHCGFIHIQCTRKAEWSLKHERVFALLEEAVCSLGKNFSGKTNSPEH